MSIDPIDRNSSNHAWKFYRVCGFDQVRLESGSDLTSLDQLDQKLWVALSCPTQGLEFDTDTLKLIDTDNDSRIRVPEILAATRWATSLLKDPAELLKSSESLPLAAINDATPDGQRLLISARQILANLGKPDADAISIEDTTDTAKIFAQTRFNGDGIIPADASDEPAIQSIINDIIDCLGSETDRSSKPGINQTRADQFFTDAQAYCDWWSKGQADSSIHPLGASTATAFAALNSIKAKVDDYFARCRLAAFDSRAIAALNRQESEYLSIAAQDLTITAAEVAGFPLARIEPNQPLPLCDGLNPAWRTAIASFRSQVVQPLLGEKSTLSESDWDQITKQFAAYDAWNSAKAGSSVEKLGAARLHEILTGQSRAAINELIAKDSALESSANAIAEVDKLVRYNRDLYRLLNNFVSFRDFYGSRRAVFQVGTLYLDQRSCSLCIRVDDMARHATMSHLSRTYLAYCDLVRKSTGEKMTIAAAFTDGDSDNLMVGRNGIFYDRKGNDWDATIIKIVDNPISIHQAFVAPYKRVLRWIEEQMAKRAAAADAASQEKLTTAAAAVGHAAETGTAPTPKMKIDIGVVAALGVAIGGITAALGVLLQAFFNLGAWMPVGFIALILLISGPSMAIAWLKLRQRNLGPILDANGWAVNAKARITIPFGASLTRIAKLPPGSERNLTDPYAESTTGRNRLIAAAVLLLAIWGTWNFGLLEKAFPNIFPKSEWIKQHSLPSLQIPATAPSVAAGK